MDDLQAAAEHVRRERGGPVAAIGFSAGGHLIASLGCARRSGEGGQLLDGQLLVYPAIVIEPDDCDFHNRDGRGGFPKKAPQHGQSGRLGKGMSGHHGLLRLHLKASGCPRHS